MLQMDRDYKEGNRSMFEAEDWRAKNDRFGHAMVAWSDALSAVPTAWAAYDMAISSGVPKSMGGTGEPNDPYQIATAEQLIAIGSDPNLLDKHFLLVADIDQDPNLAGGRVFDNAKLHRPG